MYLCLLFLFHIFSSEYCKSMEGGGDDRNSVISLLSFCVFVLRTVTASASVRTIAPHPHKRSDARLAAAASCPRNPPPPLIGRALDTPLLSCSHSFLSEPKPPLSPFFWMYSPLHYSFYFYFFFVYQKPGSSFLSCIFMYKKWDSFS